MKKKSDEKTTKHEAVKPHCAEPGTIADAGEADAGSWETDQKKRSYYYDDAHGYEIYDPETDDEDEDA